MSQFKAILINPQTRQISEIGLMEENQLSQFYRLIDCRCVDTISLANGDTAWIDDEGLMQMGQSFFHLPGLLEVPIGGSCVITGAAIHDHDQLADCKHDLIELMQRVQWLSVQAVLAMLP